MLLGKPGIHLELALIQEPNGIHRASQVARAAPSILGIWHHFPASQLGGVVDQQAGTRVSGVEGSHVLEGVDNRALLFTHILLEGATLPEAIDNDQAGLHQLH